MNGQRGHYVVKCIECGIYTKSKVRLGENKEHQSDLNRMCERCIWGISRPGSGFDFDKEGNIIISHYYPDPNYDEFARWDDI